MKHRVVGIGPGHPRAERSDGGGHGRHDHWKRRSVRGSASMSWNAWKWLGSKVPRKVRSFTSSWSKRIQRASTSLPFSWRVS